MARPRLAVDIFQTAAQPVPIGAPAKLPLTVRSPAHSFPGNDARFRFENLLPLGDFAHVIAEQFLNYVSGKKYKSAKGQHFLVATLFNWVAEGEHAAEISSGLDAARWEFVAERWASSVRENTKLAASTRNGYILGARRFLKHLQRKAIIPKFKLPKGVKGAALVSGHKKSMAQIPPRTKVSDSLPEAISAAGPEVEQLWRKLATDFDTTDPAVVLERINAQLDYLRGIAEAAIRSNFNDHLETITLAKSVDISRVNDFLRENQGRYSRSLGSGRGSKSIFEDEANFVAYIFDAYLGVVPTRFEDPRLYRLLCNKHDGVKEMSARFHLTTETAIPYIVIILLETAMNVVSALELDVKCLTETDELTNYRLSWYKDRAEGGLPRDDYFRSGDPTSLRRDSNARISLPQIVQCLRVLRAPIVPLADHWHRDSLFLMRIFGKSRNEDSKEPRVGIMSETLEGKAWKRFREADPLLSQFPTTLDQVRTTVALKISLESGNNIFTVNKKLHQESLSVTADYLAHDAVHSVNQAQARQLQDFMFLSATANLDEIRRSFGPSEERAHVILARARGKGFGQWPGSTSNAVPTESEDEPIEGTFVEWLTRGTIHIIEDVIVAAEMFAFRRHILSESPHLRMTPAWAEMWAPFVLFLNASLDCTPAHVRLDGERMAEELEIFYGDLD